MNPSCVANSLISPCSAGARLAKYALAIALAAAPVGATADTIFKCTGSDGQTHYQASKCETGQQGGQLVIKQTIETPAASNDPAAFVIVNRDSTNEYFLMGTINGYPTLMLIDTGATMVSLSPSLAQKIGAKCESSATVNTAGGTSEVCTSRVHLIKLGSITLADVEVIIMPGLEIDVLLGQSALKRLKVEQANGQIRLSVIEGVTK